MNQTDVPSHYSAAKALDILSALAAGDDAASSDWTEALVSALSSLLPAPAARAEAIVGTDAKSTGLRWHAERLVDLCRAPAATLGPAERARRRCHARMLRHGIAPHRVDFRPLVSVVVPVYNRAGPLAEAVRSCIGQTWRPLEIVVVDDGSTDDVRTALRPFGDRVRLLRKENGGVASARNLGVAQAHGDFVHFLDSDDLLTPRAVESKVMAFVDSADAEVCYGPVQSIDMRTTPPTVRQSVFRPPANPNRTMIVGFPFLLQATMLPRWRLLQGPAFEEDLRRSSDFRFWQRLGFAGARVIGTRELGLQFRRFEDSLHRTPETEDDSHALALLRGLTDLAHHPQAWCHGADYISITAHRRVHHWLDAAPSPRVRAAAHAAAAALASLTQAGPSALPMLAAMHDRIARLAARSEWPMHGAASIYRLLAETIKEARRKAPAFSADDLAFWRRAMPAVPAEQRLPAFFAALDADARPAAQARLVDALLRSGERIAARRVVRRAARLQRWLGARLAAAIA
jgi:glycosyltransferase involved in cell wall biosynthesis